MKTLFFLIKSTDVHKNMTNYPACKEFRDTILTTEITRADDCM